MVIRHIENTVKKRMADEKAIVIMGPRQSGKTTMVRNIVRNSGKEFLWFNGDDADTRDVFSKPTTTRLKSLIGKKKILVIDEAQRIENIGLCIKIIVDTIKTVKVIATGSSSFDLANKVNEPLTGRKWEFQLLPLSIAEMSEHHNFLEEKRLLERRLIYGYYPDIVNHPGDETERLQLLSDSFLYKDILMWERILKPEKLERLVQSLALQLGNQVNFTELGRQCGLDNETAEKYVNLLEKAFVIYRLPAFGRNLRTELKKSRKIYFYDNGLRNAVIKQFGTIPLRNDIGALWENFLVGERKKWMFNTGKFANTYFWRTLNQEEIDYIEDKNGKLSAFEFKWNPKRKVKFPKNFLRTYPGSETEVISPENFEEFVGV